VLNPFGAWEGVGEHKNLLSRPGKGSRTSALIREKSAYPEWGSRKQLKKGIELSLRFALREGLAQAWVLHNEQFGIEGTELQQHCRYFGNDQWQTVGKIDDRGIRIDKVLKSNCRVAAMEFDFTPVADGSMQVRVVNPFERKGAELDFTLRKIGTAPSAPEVAPPPAVE
jgi:hypothetical protein